MVQVDRRSTVQFPTATAPTVLASRNQELQDVAERGSAAASVHVGGIGQYALEYSLRLDSVTRRVGIAQTHHETGRDETGCRPIRLIIGSAATVLYGPCRYLSPH